MWVKLTETPRLLRFQGRDDGPGFPGTGDPRSIRNVHDRMEAVGGRLSVEARPGHDTTVSGSVDLR